MVLFFFKGTILNYPGFPLPQTVLSCDPSSRAVHVDLFSLSEGVLCKGT